MSYEGYNIYLCVNGHYNCYDCMNEAPVECEDCKEAQAWVWAVDMTNDGGVEPVFMVHKPAEVEECPTCGHTKRVSEEQFEIPENAGRLLVHWESLNVPFGPVKFMDNDSGETFNTKDEAWANKGWGNDR